MFGTPMLATQPDLGHPPLNSMGLWTRENMKKEGLGAFPKLGITVNLTQPMEYVCISAGRCGKLQSNFLQLPR